MLAPVRVVRAEFARLFEAHGITTHPAEVRSLAARFCASGKSLAEVEAVVLAYADPTGETVARKVDRGQTSLDLDSLRSSGGGSVA